MNKLLVMLSVLLLPSMAFAAAEDLPFTFYPAYKISGGPDFPCKNETSFIYDRGPIKASSTAVWYMGSVCVDNPVMGTYASTDPLYMWLYYTSGASYIASEWRVDCVARTVKRLYASSGATDEQINNNKVPAVGTATFWGTTPPQMLARSLCAGTNRLH